MLKSILKTSVYIACMAGYGIANAAGLGGINITSSLGQPLKAEIEVVSVDKADKPSLRAKLASADAYKNAGVDYPFSIPKLKFQIEERANGDPYIKVTTLQPINDPFVSLMVELNWSSGKLLREYTFLLDPVDYKPEQPKAEEVKPIEPVLAVPVVEPAPVPLAAVESAASAPVAAEPLAEKPITAEAVNAEAIPVEAAPAVAPIADSAVVAAPVAEAAPVQQTLPQASAPVVAAAPIAATPIEETPIKQDALSKEEAIAEASPATAASEPEHIVVVRGDTLAKIAAQVKPADVSLERMLVSLYRENAGVFDGHNMNRIRAGKILNIPQDAAVQMLPQADAVEEIRAQAADWNAYRQKLAAARTAKVESEGKHETAGKISTAVTDKAVANKEPAKEVLKLSKGEAPNDKAVGSGKATTQEKAIAKEEESIAKNKALKEAEERTALLEKNVKDMKHLAELKEAAAVSAPAAAVTMNAASAPQAASGVVPAKPKVVAPKVVEEPSLVDQLLDEPLYLAGGAALLLALGGAGFVVARRGKQGGGKKKSSAKKTGEDTGSATGRFAAPAISSPDTGDFTHASIPTPSPIASADSEEVDPIGEADLFLTFGRDAQAEEVLKEALKKNPNNLPVKLKLLSIFVSRKDTDSFYSYAREIKESGDESAWKQTADMGRELDPRNPFYGGDAASAPPVAESKPAATPSVDFDLGFGSSAAQTTPAFGTQNTVVLENTNSQEKTSIMSSADLHAAAAQTTPMDFDITGTNPGMPAMKFGGSPNETANLNMDDLVFDVTATHSNIPAMSAAAAAPASDAGMAFTLDFPTESKSKPAVTTRDMGLDEITLNLDQSGISAGTSAPKDEHWQEVATKLDLAKAYQEMGDAAGAREILEEVLRDGDAQQRDSAQTLLQQL